MPHSGVYQAARDSKNGILQPEELDGVGEYAIRASVVSPSLNVLCVNLNKTELAPLVYVTWPNATLANSTTNPGRIVAWSGYQSEIQLANSTSYLNRTVVDDIFEWGAKYSRQPPIFPEVLGPILSSLDCYCSLLTGLVSNRLQLNNQYLGSRE